ncbi:DUF721 domain-containing protein [Candidatus Peregrinibacteria bacterium]|nr:DUF721 domain-containing protein [Candidatus Peregrinibacteria bacterium]
MAFEPLQKFIPRAASKYGISREMKAAKICHDFRILLPELFKENKDALFCIAPAHYQGDTLTVNVSTPAWAQEIIMRKPKIIAELNAKAGKEIIKNLRTQLF